MKDNSVKPVHSLRFGRMQATIWPNETKSGPRFNVTVCRLYHENGAWKRPMQSLADFVLELPLRRLFARDNRKRIDSTPAPPEWQTLSDWEPEDLKRLKLEALSLHAEDA